MRYIVSLFVLAAWIPGAAAEHGMPGDNLHKHYELPQFGYLVLAGGNGITTDMWLLVKRKRRLVSTKNGKRHIVPLRLVAAYDREVPNFSAAGGYGENCIVLRPTRRLKPGRTYQLEVRDRVAKRWTYRRVSTFTLSLVKRFKKLPVRLVSARIVRVSKADPDPIAVLSIRGGQGDLMWVTSRITKTRGGRRLGTTQTRHLATTPHLMLPRWLGQCAFHPISGSATTSVVIRFRVADRTGRKTSWSKPIKMKPHGQLNVCVLAPPKAPPKPRPKPRPKP